MSKFSASMIALLAVSIVLVLFCGGAAWAAAHHQPIDGWVQTTIAGLIGMLGGIAIPRPGQNGGAS